MTGSGDARALVESCLVEAEGFPRKGNRCYPYRDTRGLWTIGIGTLISAEPELMALGLATLQRDGISVDHALRIFRKDVDESEAAAKSVFPMMDEYKTRAPQFWAALVELFYNVGDLKAKWPRFCAAVKSGSVMIAIRELANNKVYFGQVGYNRFTRIIAQLTYG